MLHITLLFVIDCLLLLLFIIIIIIIIIIYVSLLMSSRVFHIWLFL